MTDKKYSLQHLLDNNQRWMDRIQLEHADFFATIASKNKPKYMWIGCSDSRVPANEIIDLYPGEVFVHRNVGNVVVNSDLNVLSSIQFAVDQLKVEHIMVVGHYDCGGVKAALSEARIGLVDNWLRHIQSVKDIHEKFLDNIDPEQRSSALTELNVIEQLVRVAKSTVVQDAWDKGQKLELHGWVYKVTNGEVTNLNIMMDNKEAIREQRYNAISSIRKHYFKEDNFSA